MNTTQQEMAAREGQSVTPAKAQQAVLPPVDIFEDESGIVLYADLPGVSSEGLDVQVDENALTLRAEMNTPVSAGTTFTEMRGSRYERRFTVSRELDADKIDANLDNGVLRLQIPKRAEHKPRRIQINS